MFDIFSRTLTVRRTQLEQDEDFIMRPSVTEYIEIRAIIQTADAEILQALPEGYRTTELYVVFTDTRLRASLINLANADVVLMDNEEYQVIKIQNWIDSPCSNNHYEALISKIKGGL